MRCRSRRWTRCPKGGSTCDSTTGKGRTRIDARGMRSANQVKKSVEAMHAVVQENHTLYVERCSGRCALVSSFTSFARRAALNGVRPRRSLRASVWRARARVSRDVNGRRRLQRVRAERQRAAQSGCAQTRPTVALRRRRPLRSVAVRPRPRAGPSVEVRPGEWSGVGHPTNNTRPWRRRCRPIPRSLSYPTPRLYSRCQCSRAPAMCPAGSCTPAARERGRLGARTAPCAGGARRVSPPFEDDDVIGILARKKLIGQPT